MTLVRVTVMVKPANIAINRTGTAGRLGGWPVTTLVNTRSSLGVTQVGEPAQEGGVRLRAHAGLLVAEQMPPWLAGDPQVSVNVYPDDSIVPAPATAQVHL
jgi:hypothetical protein